MNAAVQTPEEKPLNRRQYAKAQTRAKILEVSTRLFKAGLYEQATIRSIAKAAGMSTGAVFANWDGKADLWREAMGCEPPGDSPATRAAPQMLSALRMLQAVRPIDWADEEDADLVAAWRAADAAVALAMGQEVAP